MNITKCPKDHFYDSDKFVSCPHCANQVAETTVDDILGSSQGSIDTAIPDLFSQDASRRNYRKTVGWLVCIDGIMHGESFVLRDGDNFIGRAGNMDVPLTYEQSVSRNKHAAITYDSEKNVFHLHSPKHPEQTLCNHKIVKIRRKLKNRDIITLGECNLMFVALCDSSFTWENAPMEQPPSTTPPEPDVSPQETSAIISYNTNLSEK